MSIEINTEIKDSYLQISCKGLYEFSAIKDIFMTAIHLTEEKQCKYLLLDLREITGDTPSTMERYELGEHVASLQRNANIRINIAVVGNEPMIDPERFGETVALNRGVTGKVFTNFDDAVIWIKKNIDGDDT